MFATFDRYRAPVGAYDEMFDGETVRGPYARIHSRVTALSPEELRARADFLARSYVDQGVTFDIGGEERPFPLDILPRVIDAPSAPHSASRRPRRSPTTSTAPGSVSPTGSSPAASSPPRPTSTAWSPG